MREIHLHRIESARQISLCFCGHIQAIPQERRLELCLQEASEIAEVILSTLPAATIDELILLLENAERGGVYEDRIK